EQQWRQKEQIAVRSCRNDDLLEDELEDVGERLQQPERPHAIGPDTDLHPADDLALRERQIRNREDQRHDDGDDLSERPYQRPGWTKKALEGVEHLVHYTGSTEIGPNMGPSVRVETCAAAMRTQPSGTPLSRTIFNIASALSCRIRAAAPSAMCSLASVAPLARATGARASLVCCSERARRTRGSAK